MPLAVVYEDDALIAVSKPAGQIVIPGRGDLGEPLNVAAARHTGSKVFVVHRLDREASGLVLFAKDARTHQILCSLFEKRRVRKKYLALVEAQPPERGHVARPIREFGSGRMGIGEGGKPAFTRYKVRERLRGAALLEVDPVTGRRHQIRVHLYALGHPILGDPLYGAARPVGGAPRLMLHAWQLALKTDRELELRAELPEDFARFLADLRQAP